MSKITIALVGAAHIHTPGFVGTIKNRFTDTVTVSHVYDHDLPRAEKTASELGATATANLDDIAGNPNIVAAIVCSETVRHEALVLPLIAAKKHLFVEKPLGFGAPDARVLAQAMDAAGTLFSTGYFRRGDAKMQFLKEAVDAQKFGTITRVRGSNCHSGALGGWFDSEWRWMADVSQSGCGGFGDLGTHMLDLLLWMFGTATSVTAHLSNGTNRYGCDEWGEGMIRFESGTVATLAAGWNDICDPVEMEICGTEGHALIVNGKLCLQGKAFGDAKISEPYAGEIGANIPAGLDAFLNALVTGEKSSALVSATEAAYRNAVMSAFYSAAKAGVWGNVAK
ncbi:MAG: Gfo/Idh/MocA family oxidoreductase [Armatimonadetes bacterium]|nr:Gfo/Idh/MocA family oxidoreductase [Armatimonadota bacterium]